MSRARVRGELKRQDAGVLRGGAILPRWEVRERGTTQGNRKFSPLIGSVGNTKP